MKVVTVKDLKKLIDKLPDDTGIFVTDAFSRDGWLQGRAEFSIARMRGEDAVNFPEYSKAKDAKLYLLIKS